ncbi:Apolipoprotein N-acyltransferase [Cyclonatronum proteinivorum]|uniref:Apolipoprotein N-acyltransferase n=1 Tax=Cyclonatronum proteinivorum TaxID=1457365 RepID=A0A345UL72_9BACT|nr:apolipoprotein N-acyltransferase [Cyclonatronum proteinivorum]AXJ01224.1 Apolipoprotein N-acyltransferase [Cyclonatronum proteinivorum]
MPDFLFRLSKWQLSLAAGLLMGLSFSPFPFPFLLFPAFILMLRLSALSNTYREAAYHSYPAFLLWNIITTYWLTMATVIGGVAAILANSAIMSLVFGLMHLCLRRISNRTFAYTAAAAIWVSYEWLHLHWDLAWPWLVLANAWATWTFAVQYIEFTGFLSVSFLTLLIAFLAGKGLGADQQTSIRPALNGSTAHPPKPDKHALATAAGLWLGSIILSLLILWRTDFTPEGHTHVVVAQPNYDSYLPLAGYDDTTTPLLELTAMLDSVVTANTHIMFWPENALMGRVSQLNRSSNDLHILQKAAQWNVPVITGAAFFMYYQDEDPPRVHRTDYLGRPFNIFNSAVGFFPDGSFEHYNKIRLVPIVERLPFAHTLSRLPLPLDWGDVTGFGRGERMHVFEATNGTLAPAVVCYDSVFPAVVRESVRMGAGFIAVITNDGWWGRTSGHLQHYEFARLRAIELRRAVVRSANNGISGMITPDGRPHTRTEYWTRTAFELEVPTHTRLTLYARFGDWFSWLMLLISILGLSLAYRK